MYVARVYRGPVTPAVKFDKRLRKMTYIRIAYIKNSERYTEPVEHYTYSNRPYQNVRVLGRICNICIRNRYDDYVIILDDSSGEIACILPRQCINATSRKRKALKNELRELKRRCNIDQSMTYETIDNELARRLYVANQGVLMEKLIAQLNNTGYNTDYELGGHVSVTGPVMDPVPGWRIIYVHCIAKINTENDLLREMNEQEENCLKDFPELKSED